MRRRVYLETSVVSYLASRPSRDLVTAGRQQLTQIWWEIKRPAFDLVISQVVLDEAVAAYHGVDFLLTWNVAHIANAAIRRRVEGICREQGYEPPILCTPDELMEGSDE